MTAQFISIGSPQNPLAQQGRPVVIFAMIEPVHQRPQGVAQQPSHRHAPE